MWRNSYATVVPEEMMWENRTWRNVFFTDPDQGFSWDTAGILDYDNRAIRNWFNVIYFPRTVAERPATLYVDTPLDKEGNVLQPNRTYKLTVPEKVPVSKFWSLTIYDMATWTFIYTPEGRSGLSSYDRDKGKINDDGSVDLYFGLKAPKG